MIEKLDKNNCFDGELLASYIYGELEISAVERFDLHLLDCNSCQREFSTFSEARLSVFEWNKYEFEPLVTPEIHIVYGESRSWLSTFWDLFVLPNRWPVAAASFATIAVLLATTFILFYGANNTPEIVTSNRPKIESREDTKTDNPRPIPYVEPAAESRLKNVTAVVGKPEVVSISTKPLESHLKPQKRNFNGRTSQPKSIPPTAAIGLTTPVRLNNFEELQDDSPRLSDLFDETEAS